MEDSKVTFTRSSDVTNKNLNSLILEAYVDGKNTAIVFCENMKWYVMMGSADGDFKRILWEDFLRITHEFSVFVVQESEYLLKNGNEIFEDDGQE